MASRDACRETVDRSGQDGAQSRPRTSDRPIVSASLQNYAFRIFDLTEYQLPDGAESWVPFLAAYPGVFPAGLEYSNPVSTLDIFPTVTALAGITPPAGLDGVNLTPFLKGEDKTPPHANLFFHTTKHGAIRQTQWKLVLTQDGRSELFDLAKDTEEKQDLSSAEPERVKMLAKTWQDWKARMANPPTPAKSPAQ